MWGGKIDYKNTALLFAIGFVFLFTVGGVTGIVLSNASLDIALHDGIPYHIIRNIIFILFPLGKIELYVFSFLFFYFQFFLALSAFFIPPRAIGARGIRFLPSSYPFTLSQDISYSSDVQFIARNYHSVVTNSNNITLEYIHPFFVGLLEGDGTIYIAKNKGNKSYGIFCISLKFLPENEQMLKLIVQYIGGSLNFEKKKGIIVKVRWWAISKKDVKNCLSLLDKYPLLTSRKICQLQHLKNCIINNNWDYHIQTRSSKFSTQQDIIQAFNKDFILPSYFAPWLSGFIEAESCFRKSSFYISQNNDWYILNALKTYFNSSHKIGINKDCPRPTAAGNPRRIAPAI